MRTRYTDYLRKREEKDLFLRIIENPLRGEVRPGNWGAVLVSSGNPLNAEHFLKWIIGRDYYGETS